MIKNLHNKYSFFNMRINTMVNTMDQTLYGNKYNNSITVHQATGFLGEMLSIINFDQYLFNFLSVAFSLYS